MFKSLRSIFITFAILGSLVVLTGTRYGTPTSSTPSITDDGVTVDFSKPITGSVSTDTLRIDSVIVNALQAAGATLNGGSAVIKGQSGGTCCAEGAGTAGGQVQLTSGAGGPGTGAAASGAGASIIATGGAAGADGGAGQGLGGGISLIGGAGATSADQGAISYQGRRHLWATSGSSRWEIDINGNFLPIDDSTYDIGSATVRPDEIFVDDLIAEQVGWSAAGSAADVFIKRAGANELDVRNGTAAQRFRVYETFTDFSNNERFEIRMGGNLTRIQTDSIGTGVAHNMIFGTVDAGQTRFQTSNVVRWFVDATGGHLVPNADSTYDIGLTSSGVNVFYVSDRIEHAADTDTMLTFANDDIQWRIGNIRFLQMNEGATDRIIWNPDSMDVDFDVNSDNVSDAFTVDAGADTAAFNVPLTVNNILFETNNTYSIGTTTVGPVDIFVNNKIERTGDSDTFIDFNSNVIDFDAGGIELMSLDHSSIDPTGIVFNTSQDIDMDLTWSSDNVTGAFFLDAGADDAKFRIPQGHSNTAVALGAAAVTFSADTNFVTVTGDGGTNTIATITSGTVGETLSLLFVDALVTITDDDSHAADSVDLSAAFTGADDTMLTLLYDGTSWYELSRSVN